jgi:hypothetical protein
LSIILSEFDVFVVLIDDSDCGDVFVVLIDDSDCGDEGDEVCISEDAGALVFAVGNGNCTLLD